MAKLRRTMGFMERWVWYHLAGFVLTVVLMLCLDPLDDLVGLNTGRVPVGISIALGIGIMQWAVLRRHGVGPAWVMCLVTGFIVGFVLADLFQGRFFPNASDNILILAIAASAFFSSILQYVIILRDIPGAGPRWLWINTLGWTVAGLASSSVSMVAKWNLQMPGFISLPIALVLILSGAPLLAWITGRHLRDLFMKVPEIPEADVGHDLI